MITGSHVILYSTDAEADRAFLRDVLGLAHVDAGHGWLIFALPPAEIAVHPAEDNLQRDVYLLCDELPATLSQLEEHGVGHTSVTETGWGKVTHLTLPGGGRLGLYEPKHALAIGLRGL